MSDKIQNREELLKYAEQIYSTIVSITNKLGLGFSPIVQDSGEVAALCITSNSNDPIAYANQWLSKVNYYYDKIQEQ